MPGFTVESGPTWHLRRLAHSLRFVAIAALAGLIAERPSAAQTGAVRDPTRLALIAQDLTAPVHLESVPDGSGRRIIVEQTGLVHVLDEQDQRRPEPLLDLRPNIVALLKGFDERGLLGFAFHPGFSENGRFYVSYSAPLHDGAPRAWNHTRRVSEFTVEEPSSLRANIASERVLIALDWPSRKHNGGGLAFGPDGFLYIGLGDGGGAHGIGAEVLYDAFSVPAANRHFDELAQDISTLFGKILRVDVNGGFPGYAIPPTNPFAGRTGKDEIYAWGFRNPYRISFDRSGTGDLFVTAIAETLWEAVYRVSAPGNYGWSIREGTHCFDRTRPLDPPPQCPRAGRHGWRIHDPIIEYPNMSVHREGARVNAQGLGTAVVGGILYRGLAIESLRGHFLLGDWSRDFRNPSGQLFQAIPPRRWGETWQLQPFLELDTRVISISQDDDGEPYILTSDEFGPFGTSGKVYRLLR